MGPKKRTGKGNEKGDDRKQSSPKKNGRGAAESYVSHGSLGRPAMRSLPPSESDDDAPNTPKKSQRPPKPHTAKTTSGSGCASTVLVSLVSLSLLASAGYYVYNFVDLTEVIEAIQVKFLGEDGDIFYKEDETPFDTSGQTQPISEEEEVPIVDDDAPEEKEEVLEVKEAPAVKEEVPEVKEAPKVKEEVPKVKEEVPELKEEVPEVKEEVPEVKEEVPEVEEEVPEVKEAPKVKEEVPEVKDVVPEVKEEVPEVKEEVPELKEEVSDVKKEVPEVKEEVPEVKEEVLEVEEKVPEVGEEVSELKEEVSEVKEVPEVTEKVPEVKKEVAQMKEVPEVTEKVPEVKEVVSDVKEDVPEVKEEVPEVKEEVPEVKEEVREVKEEVSEVKEEVPEVKEEVSEVKEEVSEVKEEVPEVKEEVPEVKEEVSEVKEEVPEVKEEVSEVKEEVPEVKEEVPEVKEEVPEVKEEVPEVKEEETPEVKDETPAAKDVTPEVKEDEVKDVRGSDAPAEDRRLCPDQSYYQAAITNKLDYDIRDSLDEADKLLRKKPLDAYRLYSELLAAHPGSPRATAGRADALCLQAEQERSNSRLEECVAHYLELLEVPDVPKQLMIQKAKECATKQQFRGWGVRAIKVIRRLVELFPEEQGLINDLGVQCLMVGRNEEGRQAFQKMLEVDPNNGFAQAHLGFIIKNTDKNSEKAIPYLRYGIDSGEPGTIDGRFFFHLGDAYQRTGHPDKAYETYKLGADKGLFRSMWQRSLYNVDSLQSHPWWTQVQTKQQSLFQLLEKNWEAIRDEGLANMDESLGVFKPEEENLRETGDWKQFTLFQQGHKREKNCERAPKTCALIERFPEAAGCKRGQVKFSIMQPGVHVWPHCGPTNCRIRSHLGLVIPDGCRIRVVNDTRTWEEGKVIVFDDSFEHEVWHDGDSFRLVLIVDVWHPDLSARQKNTLTAI